MYFVYSLCKITWGPFCYSDRQSDRFFRFEIFFVRLKIVYFRWRMHQKNKLWNQSQDTSDISSGKRLYFVSLTIIIPLRTVGPTTFVKDCVYLSCHFVWHIIVCLLTQQFVTGHIWISFYCCLWVTLRWNATTGEACICPRLSLGNPMYLKDVIQSAELDS